MVPTKVQHKPDGPWQPWVSGNVDSDILRLKQRMSNGAEVYINGCVVHSLKFEGGREWNTKEGWK